MLAAPMSPDHWGHLFPNDLPTFRFKMALPEDSSNPETKIPTEAGQGRDIQMSLQCGPRPGYTDSHVLAENFRFRRFTSSVAIPCSLLPGPLRAWHWVGDPEMNPV